MFRLPPVTECCSLVLFFGTVLGHWSLDTRRQTSVSDTRQVHYLVMDLPGDSDLRSDPSPVAKFFRSIGVVSINGYSFDTMTNLDPCD